VFTYLVIPLISHISFQRHWTECFTDCF